MPIFAISRRAIYEQVASNRPLTADSVGDVGATSDVEVNAAASAVIDVSETVARTSVLLDLVQTVARIVKVAGEKAAGAVETAEQLRILRSAFPLLVVCSRRSQLL